MLYGTWALCADCAADHAERCQGAHVANYETAPGFCLGERCLKPTASQKPVPTLCVSERAVEGTLEEIERRRELRKEEKGSHPRSEQDGPH